MTIPSILVHYVIHLQRIATIVDKLKWKAVYIANLTMNHENVIVIAGVN